MLKKLNLSYLFMVFSCLTLSNMIGMQKESAPKALTEIVCKSINDYITKSSNPEEAANWIKAKELPEEVKEMVIKKLIKLNHEKLELDNFVTPVMLNPISHNAVCMCRSKAEAMYFIHTGLASRLNFNAFSYPPLAKYHKLLFITARDKNNLFIYDWKKSICIGQIDGFEYSIHSIRVSSHSESLLGSYSLMICYGDEIMILCFDAEIGKYRQAKLEEIVRLIVSCNVESSKQDLMDYNNTQESNNSKSICIVS